jgi:hypothetical protein
MKPAHQTPKSRKSSLTPNQLLKVLMAEMEKEKAGPEGEKWVMPDEPASLMADMSVERVALVAANLSRADLPAHECVLKAYEIIHWASVAHGYLHGNPHPRINRWTTLVSDYIRSEQSRETTDEEESAMSYVKWDEKNKPLPLAYVDALAAIDPKQDRTSRREPRIIEWMVAVRKAMSTQDAKKILKGWCNKNEVPFMDFDHAFYSFRIWMREKTRSQNAEKVEKRQTKKAEEKPKPKPKKKRTARASKYDGIVGKGQSEDFPTQNIPKKVLDQHS